MEKEQKRVSKAYVATLKREGFLLKGQLQKELKQGKPGGKQLTPLSWIGKGYKSDLDNRKGLWRNANKPLFFLYHGIRYHLEMTGNNPKTLRVGFVGPQYQTLRSDNGTAGGYLAEGWNEKHIVSKAWRRLAKMHQAGFEKTVTSKQRKHFVSKGQALPKRSKGRAYYFLKKSTVKMKTPARPIVDPFWNSVMNKSLRRISSNFKKKMRGERI